MATKEELEAQLETARKDIEALARMAGERVRDAASGARGKAEAHLDDLSEAARERYEEARREGARARATAEAQVRENPLLALGLAAGVGFLLAQVLRR